MDMPIAERRQIENEMIFRRANEKRLAGLHELDELHINEGNPDLVMDNDLILHFICECSDEDCDTRLPIKLSVYQKIHLNRDSFIIKAKHQDNSIEEVVLTESDYSVVKKNKSTTEPGKELNETMTNNT